MLHPANDRTIFGLYKEILLKDVYDLKSCKKIPDIIIDIGANIGFFSIYARMHYPIARIVAIEPCKETYNYLLQNTQGLNIETYNMALGNNEKLYLNYKISTGCNMFDEKTESKTNEYCDSKSLDKIFEILKIDINKSIYFIKVDCEGGEKYLLNNEKIDEIIKKSIQFSMEIHFPAQNVPRFNSLPEYDIYNNWIKEKYWISHEIKYWHSRRKLGNGIYILRKK